MIVTLSACLTGTADADVRCRPDATVADALAAAGLGSREVWHGRELVLPATRIDSAEVGHAARLTARPAEPAWTHGGTRLVSVSGPDAGHAIPVAGPASLGSLTPGLRDPAVSAIHARAMPRAGGLTLRDAGSANGLARVERGSRGRTVRSLRLAPGERVIMGRTVLELRAEVPLNVTLTRRALAGLERVLRVAARMRSRRRPQASPALTMPDPARQADAACRGEAASRTAHEDGRSDEWWDGAITVAGPHALDAWRALVLARGRSPYGDAPAEPWLAWLPQADPAHEPPCILAAPGSAPPGTPAPGNDGHVMVWAHADRWEVTIGALSASLPACHVSEPAADALARAAARDTPPLAIPPAWADLMPAPGAGLLAAPPAVPLGVWTADGASWELPRGQPWTLLAVGTAAQRRASLLEIVAGACAWAEAPPALRIVLVGACDDGPLARVAALPHVVQTAAPSDALGALEAAAVLSRTGDAPLIIVDDAAALAPEAARALESLVMNARGTHPARIAITSSRTAGVYSPAALACAQWLVAIDDASPQHAADLVGLVPQARPRARSRAWVRTAGAVREVLVAAATATRTPPAWRGRDDPAPGESVCAAAALRWGT